MKTTCTGKLADLYLERYLQGSLSDSEAQTFEEHYFECPECLEQVEAMQAVASKFAELPAAASQPIRPRRVIAWPTLFAALGAMAALVVAGVLTVRHLHGPQAEVQTASTVAPASPVLPPSQPKGSPVATASPGSEIASLADFSLPPFLPSHLRGGSDTSEPAQGPAFTHGMEAYVHGDCASAIQFLSQLGMQDGSALAARFYAGVCEMKLGNVSKASADLKLLAEAEDSPQQEAALYYLAQIALAANDEPAARRYLTRTVTLRGDFERRGRAELEKLH